MKVAIIGAGVAGLRCALELTKRKIDFDIYELSAQVGGKLKTEKYDGFLLDHGFQILLPAYSEVQENIDTQKLKLLSFPAGARIWKDNQFKTLADPLRNFTYCLKTLFSGIGNFKDKILILKLLNTKPSPENQMTTLEFLNYFGFSEDFINFFFKPFFSGIYLHRSLEFPANYFLFLFNIFSKTKAALPENGIQAVAQSFLNKIDANKIHFNTKVSITDKNTLSNGQHYDKIVIATSYESLNDILGSDYKLPTLNYHYTKTFYFSCKKIVGSKDFQFLHLFPTEKTFNHIAFLTQVQPSYCDDPKLDLISISTFDLNAGTEEIANKFQRYFGDQIENLKFIKEKTITYALPATLIERSELPREFIFAGDYLETPSVQGAMIAGLKASNEIIQKHF